MQEDWQENLVPSNKILMQVSEDISFHDEIRDVGRAFTVLIWFYPTVLLHLNANHVLELLLSETYFTLLHMRHFELSEDLFTHFHIYPTALYVKYCAEDH